MCEFCGTQITSDMRREQEQINKQGCPKCGSSNIQFKRENQGEVQGKKSKQVIHRTVGFCKDCGYTWYADAATQPKKRKTWLWVLGWICVFPVPLTILMFRNKSMKPVLKYGIIAAGWIVYLLIALSGMGSDKSEIPAPTEAPTATVAPTETPAPTSAPEPEESAAAAVSVETAVAALDLVLRDNYGDSYKVDVEDNFITISVWVDGVAIEAAAAANGDTAKLESWNGMVEAMTEAQKSYQNTIRDTTGQDAIVMVNVLNDQNLDNTLLSVTDGTVVYDAVNGINILG